MTDHNTIDEPEDGHARVIGDDEIISPDKTARVCYLSQFKTNKDFRNTIIVFVLLFGSLFFTLIPFSVASFFTLMLSICSVSGAYSLRSLAEEDSVLENHMTFFIMTFWRVALFLLITSIFAIMFLLIFSNYHRMGDCVRNMDNVIFSGLGSRNAGKVNTLFEYCSALFYKNNSLQIRGSMLIAFAPVVLYLFYRAIKCWGAILYGMPIEKIKKG